MTKQITKKQITRENVDQLMAEAVEKATATPGIPVKFGDRYYLFHKGLWRISKSKGWVGERNVGERTSPQTSMKAAVELILRK